MQSSKSRHTKSWPALRQSPVVGLFCQCLFLYYALEGKGLAVDTKAEAGEERSFSTEAWSQVLSAVDKAYAELVSYQERLEQQNEDLREFRRLLGSIQSFVSDVMLALGRSGVIEDGRIANYQIVGPATWNFLPRDAEGQPGPLEAALVGTPAADAQDAPLSVLQFVRSFDPCVVCTVH